MDISGSMLRDAVISAANSVANNKRSVDELNVFPVPDGDTGTNMSMTMSNALRELKRIDDNATVTQVADVTASSMLRGARGNSGVILSLLFRGFSKGMHSKRTATAEDLSKALAIGVDSAYKAVMKPTEGTILTVARVAAENANALIGLNSEVDPVNLWARVVETAQETLDKTPQMLPVLAKAGVVDAGGKGLVIIFDAMLSVFRGNGIIEVEDEASKPIYVKREGSLSAPGEADGEITFTYCTEFIVNREYGGKDPLLLRAFLETIGDSVVVVDDEEIIKIHVHTDHPGKAFEEGLLFGSLTAMKVENMREQHEEKVREAKLAREQDFIPVPPEKRYGFVAVAAGAGVETIFTDLGVDCVVKGGQTMNPSTEDILRAIHSTPAEIVFVLPNNKNIIMAAEQTVSLADRRVCVLQTRTIPQGISAMLAFDAEADFNRNRIDMTKAFDKVSTGQITFAARDSDYDGHDIKQGEILALDNGKLAFTERDVTKAAVKLTKRLTKSDAQFITIIYGSDVTEENAIALHQTIQAKAGSGVEVTLVNGGQPIYYYIISVE